MALELSLPALIKRTGRNLHPRSHGGRQDSRIIRSATKDHTTRKRCVEIGGCLYLTCQMMHRPLIAERSPVPSVQIRRIARPAFRSEEGCRRNSRSLSLRSRGREPNIHRAGETEIHRGVDMTGAVGSPRGCLTFGGSSASHLSRNRPPVGSRQRPAVCRHHEANIVTMSQLLSAKTGCRFWSA
jgi:hypothetical protein